jgi:predicted transcriptional regulator of viral defense system
MTFRSQVYELALSHHGLVTTSRAAAAGVPAVELRKLAHRGALTQLTYGVYRFDAIPADRYSEYAEAVLRVGEDAFLTHDAVLALHELALVNPRAIKVGTARRVRRRLPDWVELIQRTDDVDITEYEGVRSTTLARALRDCVGTVPRDRLLGAAEEARLRGLLRRRDVAELTDAIDAIDARVIA